MADTLSASLKLSTTWSLVEALDLGNVTETGSLLYDKEYGDGTTAGKAQQIWHDTVAITASATNSHDLTALARTIFGTAHSNTIVRMLTVLIKNNSTTTGDNLLWNSAATAAMLAPFVRSQASAGVVIPAGGWFVWSTHGDTGTTAQDVTNGVDDKIDIVEQGGANAYTYDIIILGT